MIYLFESEKGEEEKKSAWNGRAYVCVISNEAAAFREGVKSLRIISEGFKNSIKGSDEQMDLKYNILPIHVPSIFYRGGRRGRGEKWTRR